MKEYNSTFQELAAAQEGAADSDPLAKFLSDPQAVWSWLQSNDKTQELMQIMQGSVLFDKLLKFGSEVLERRQVAELSEGSLVEISGLSAAEHLNGLTGTLSQATEEEMEEPGLSNCPKPSDSGFFLFSMQTSYRTLQGFQTARMESVHILCYGRQQKPRRSSQDEAVELNPPKQPSKCSSDILGGAPASYSVGPPEGTFP